MDASLLVSRGGVRSLGKKKLADGNEYELYFLCRTDQELASHFGAMARFEKIDDPQKQRLAILKYTTELVQAAMCQEDGSPLLTPEQASGIPLSLRFELRDLIVGRSSTFDDDLGNG